MFKVKLALYCLSVLVLAIYPGISYSADTYQDRKNRLVTKSEDIISYTEKLNEQIKISDELGATEKIAIDLLVKKFAGQVGDYKSKLQGARTEKDLDIVYGEMLDDVGQSALALKATSVALNVSRGVQLLQRMGLMTDRVAVIMNKAVSQKVDVSEAEPFFDESKDSLKEAEVSYTAGITVLGEIVSRDPGKVLKDSRVYIIKGNSQLRQAHASLRRSAVVLSNIYKETPWDLSEEV
jgi:hypothetical protein